MNSSTTVSPRSRAISLAAVHGWFVFPLRISHDEEACDGGTANCKTVDFLGQQWRKIASADVNEISRMDWSHANGYGIACGESGIWVADEDPGGEWPHKDTRIHSTGRGRHYIYDDVYGLRNGVHIRPGIDTRGVGGMIIGPGSYHPHGEYEVLQEQDPVGVPPEIITELVQKSRSKTEPLESSGTLDAESARERLTGVYARLRRAEEGSRNDTLNKMAGVAAGLWTRLDAKDQEAPDLDEDAIQRELRQAALDTGLTEGIDQTIRSGWSYGMDHPVKDDIDDPADDFALYDDLFSATPTLEHVRQAAHSRMVSAPALLCYILARVLAEVQPEVCLPPTIGGRASLNFGVTVVGGSSAGKSSLLGVSSELIGLIGMDQDDIQRELGSGEGLVQTFLRSEGQGRDRRQVLIDDPRRILTVDEVDLLSATKSRTGSTIAPVLRSALMGESLGQANADPDRNRHIPARSYRLVLLMGVQPTRSRSLLEDTDAGTPQRFVWTRAIDPTLPEEDQDWPGSLDWEPPFPIPSTIDYPEYIKEEIRDVRRRQVRDGADPLQGHVLLTRLKVATSLALLHGEVKITDQWWDLAGHVVKTSVSCVNHCKRVLAREEHRSSIARAEAEGHREVVKSSVVHDDHVKKAMAAIRKKLQDADGEWLSYQDARPRVSLRPYADEAIDRLVDAGEIEVQEYMNKGRPARRMRYIG